MNALMSVASLFAGPIGSIVNTSIKSASAAAIAWAVAKGAPLESATTIVSALALASSTIISSVAQTQGVQIPRINNDKLNGVKVVRSIEQARQVDAPSPG